MGSPGRRRGPGSRRFAIPSEAWSAALDRRLQVSAGGMAHFEGRRRRSLGPRRIGRAAFGFGRHEGRAHERGPRRRSAFDPNATGWAPRIGSVPDLPGSRPARLGATPFRPAPESARAEARRPGRPSPAQPPRPGRSPIVFVRHDDVPSSDLPGEDRTGRPGASGAGGPSLDGASLGSRSDLRSGPLQWIAPLGTEMPNLRIFSTQPCPLKGARSGGMIGHIGTPTRAWERRSTIAGILAFGGDRGRSGGIGRRASLRGWSAHKRVQVQVLSPAIPHEGPRLCDAALFLRQRGIPIGARPVLARFSTAVALPLVDHGGEGRGREWSRSLRWT